MLLWFTWEFIPKRNRWVVPSAKRCLLLHAFCNTIYNHILMLVLCVQSCVLHQTNWKHIWEFTVVRKLSVVHSVQSRLLTQVIWNYIWEFTVVRNLSVVYSVQSRFLNQALWKHIWEFTVVSNLSVVYSVQSRMLNNVFKKTFESSLWWDTQWQLTSVLLALGNIFISLVVNLQQRLASSLLPGNSFSTYLYYQLDTLSTVGIVETCLLPKINIVTVLLL